MIIIDAKNRTLGRVASQAAKALQGKNSAKFIPGKSATAVKILNISQLKFTGNKFEDKIYRHYSGFPGGLKETKLKIKFNKQPEKLVRQTVFSMLPKNRAQSQVIKKLVVKLND